MQDWVFRLGITVLSLVCDFALLSHFVCKNLHTFTGFSIWYWDMDLGCRYNLGSCHHMSIVCAFQISHTQIAQGDNFSLVQQWLLKWRNFFFFFFAISQSKDTFCQNHKGVVTNQIPYILDTIKDQNIKLDLTYQIPLKIRISSQTF